MTQNNIDYNTIIIGAGMSGMSAAIYLKRANISVCILEKSAPGGQLLRTSTVENYPAYSKVEGATLALNLYNQINTLEVPVKFEEVIKIEEQKEKRIIKTTTGEYSCRNIIIATGRMYKKLNLPQEEKLTGKGISYCAICDGALYRNKEVAVIGAGNSAFEEALYLSNLCKKVTIIARREEFRAEDTLITTVKSKENIDIETNTIVKQLLGLDKLEGLILENTSTNQCKAIKVDGCFIYIGQVPETQIFKELGIEMLNEYIITNQYMETTKKGIYACGDCRKKEIYQLVTAANDSVIAATQIIKQKERNNS